MSSLPSIYPIITGIWIYVHKPQYNMPTYTTFWEGDEVKIESSTFLACSQRRKNRITLKAGIINEVSLDGTPFLVQELKLEHSILFLDHKNANMLIFSLFGKSNQGRIVTFDLENDQGLINPQEIIGNRYSLHKKYAIVGSPGVVIEFDLCEFM